MKKYQPTDAEVHESMSVDTTDSSSRPASALQRVAGADPEGSQVERCLDEFIAEVKTSLTHATGWTQDEERAAREREEVARREEEARQAAIDEAEAARALAEAARQAAEREAERAREDERRQSERVVKLEARLAEAEERAAEAEKRARTAAATPAGPLARGDGEQPRPLRPRVTLAISAAVAFAAAAFATLLIWPGGDDRSPPPSPAKAIAPPHDPVPSAEPQPEPVVHPMLPAEPRVKPLEEDPEAGRPPGPARGLRPAGSNPAKKAATSPPAAPPAN